MSKINIIKLKSVDSTNSYAMQNISNLNDKDVIVADYQFAGKGRQGRKWITDDSKNAYVSIVLKPDINNYPYLNLTQYLSVVLCQVLEEEYKIEPTIKWPNDILVKGAKISGILCESKTINNKISALVLGVGVNLNMNIETINKIDQNVTSLNLLLNKDIDSECFINIVLEKFFADYDEFTKLGFKYIKNDYIKRCGFLGKHIKIRSNTGIEEYIAVSINDDGTLNVSNKEDNNIKIISGDLI